MIEKDLEYDSDKEKKFDEDLKGIGNKGYKLSVNFISKKRNEERLRMREKEKEYDNSLREKENKMLFKDNYNQLTENKIDNILETKEILAIAPEEKKPQTTFEIEDYVPNNFSYKYEEDINNNNNKDMNEKIIIKSNEKDKKSKEGISNIAENKKIVEEDIKEDNDINNEDNEEIDITKMNYEQLISGIPNNEYEIMRKTVINNMPKGIDELFQYKINWELINKYELKRKKIKKFIEENLIKYFDDVDSFTKFILEKLGFLSPYDLQNKLKYVLEENTEVSIYI